MKVIIFFLVSLSSILLPQEVKADEVPSEPYQKGAIIENKIDLSKDGLDKTTSQIERTSSKKQKDSFAYIGGGTAFFALPTLTVGYRFRHDYHAYGANIEVPIPRYRILIDDPKLYIVSGQYLVGKPFYVGLGAQGYFIGKDFQELCPKVICGIYFHDEAIKSFLELEVDIHEYAYPFENSWDERGPRMLRFFIPFTAGLKFCVGY